VAFHPAHQVDLILWRNLVGGVSEAAYARTQWTYVPHDLFALDANLIYSHRLGGGAATSSTSPMGVELDVGAQANLRSFVFRAEWGSLYAPRGLPSEAILGPALVHMIFLRASHAI
jgi:hypothetical protein